MNSKGIRIFGLTALLTMGCNDFGLGEAKKAASDKTLSDQQAVDKLLRVCAKTGDIAVQASGSEVNAFITIKDAKGVVLNTDMEGAKLQIRRHIYEPILCAFRAGEPRNLKSVGFSYSIAFGDGTTQEVYRILLTLAQLNQVEGWREPAAPNDLNNREAAFKHSTVLVNNFDGLTVETK